MCRCTKSVDDPHPLCPRCLQRQGIAECTPEERCIHCEHLSIGQWAKLLATRLRRKKTPMKSPQAAADSATSGMQVDIPISQAMHAASGECDEIMVSSQEENQVVDSGSDTDDDDQCLLTPPGALPSAKEAVSYEETVDPTGYVVETSSESSDEEDDGLPPTQLGPIMQPLPPPILTPEAVKAKFLRDSNDITVPAHLDWVASNTNFTVQTSVGMARRPRAALSSLGLLPEQEAPDPFVGLNVSAGLLSGFEDYAKAMADHKPISMRQSIGIYSTPPKETPPLNITTFQLGDECIRRDPMRAPKEQNEFLGAIKYNYQTVTREEDLRRLEEYSRKALIVLSNLDATMAALLNAYPASTAPDASFMKGLYRTTQGLQVLTDIHSLSLHQVVTHRRDTVINARMRSKANPVVISDEHLARLRYGPILQSQYLFEPEIINLVTTEREEEKAKRLQTAALTKLAFQSPPTQNRQLKRLHSTPSTSTGTVEKHGKKRKAMPAAQGRAPTPQFMNQGPTPKNSPSCSAQPAQPNR